LYRSSEQQTGDAFLPRRAPGSALYNTQVTSRVTVVVIVCIAIFAFAAVSAAPMFAVIDAQTPIDALFWSPTPAPAPSIEAVALPTAPVVDIRSPRAPPLA